MPKRPSALAITDDDSKILVADKFGDVYSIPLLSDPEQEAVWVHASENAEVPVKGYKPTATTLTVHSKRNREALEQQLLRSNQPVKTKERLKFQNQLLLGHVSMLTDILSIRNHAREYIVTSDRDEHIRVSRGQPQAHIIERYCLGHTKFVSKMALVRPDILVSGGGDDCLYVWQWLEGELLKRVDIKQYVLKAQNEVSGESRAASKDEVTVSGMWTVPAQSGDPVSEPFRHNLRHI